MPELDPPFFASLLVAVGALLWIYNQTRQAFGKGKAIEPQPLIVEESQRFTPLQEHQALKAELQQTRAEAREAYEKAEAERRLSVSKVYERMEDHFEEMRKEIKHDVGGFHERVNQILSELGEIRGEMKNHRHR